MKKVSLLIAMIAFAVSFSFQSCKKANEETTTERNSLIQKGDGERQIDPSQVIASIASQYGQVFDFNAMTGPHSPSNATDVSIYVVPSQFSLDYFYLTFVLDGAANILGIYVTDLSYAFSHDNITYDNYSSYFYNIWDTDMNIRMFYGYVNIGKNNQIASNLSITGTFEPVNSANYHFFYNLSVGLYDLESINSMLTAHISAPQMALQMAATFYMNLYQ